MIVRPQSLPTEPNEIISRDPATGEEFARTPITTPSEVLEAVNRARSAQPAWARLSYRERAKIVLQARELVLAELEDIATLISRETGKPRPEAISMEIVPSLDLMHYFATNSEKLLKSSRIDIALYGFMGRSSRVIYKPIGVVGIISPWNFPWATPLAEVVMALMAGNSAVLKPSELSPLTALKLGEFFVRANLPSALLEIIPGNGTTGAALVDSGVDKIMFTGSVATGKRVAEGAAKRLTPVVLELGGKDPMIVLDDANISNAARAAVWGAFCNSGQACASIERCYVHESIATQFIDKVVSQTERLKQGPTTSDEIDVGAMTNERQLQIVEEHIRDAVERGAQIRIGGKRLNSNEGWFHEPTVLTNVDHSMKIMRDETFGPVLPIKTFKTEAEAVQLANNSIYGLTASIFTSDTNRGRRLAKQIEAGTVMINEVVYTHALAQTPWGGVKQSGYGRTHGRLGLMELVVAQHIHVNSMPAIPDLWWFRYSQVADRLFKRLAHRFTDGSLVKASTVIPQILRRFLEKDRA